MLHAIYICKRNDVRFSKQKKSDRSLLCNVRLTFNSQYLIPSPVSTIKSKESTNKFIMMPDICTRFERISSLCLQKDIYSNELQNFNEQEILTVFGRFGNGLIFKIAPNPKRLNLMLKAVREKCLNIETLIIDEIACDYHVNGLPTTIRKIDMRFQGHLLDLSYLHNLDTLHLRFDWIPYELDWIEVKNRLKESNLR